MSAGQNKPLRRFTEGFDWIAASMFVASISAYTIEFWWATRWFAFA